MTRTAANRAPNIAELTIEYIGAGGDGVGSWRGEPVFVPFTVPGERVCARLGARRGGGWEGRAEAVLAAASGRADPPCPHFGRCGGCALQHLQPALYREAKLAGLRRAVARAGIDPGVIGPLRSVTPARRRMRLGLARPRDPQQPALVGLRERFRHRLVDLRQCPVMEPALFVLVAPLRRLAPALLPPGGAAEAALTRTDSGVDLLVEAAEPPALPALEALADLAAETDLARIVWRAPMAETVVVERRPVRVVLSGVAVPVPPGAFLQASAAAEAVMVEEVAAAIGKRRPALDLFAGLGPFALALSGAGPVHAVEGDGPAAAALSGVAGSAPRLTVERRDLARDPISPEELAPYAVAVFDPPRAGAAAQAAALAKATIEVVVAVSCNPATFARDARQLIGGGYRLERITPIDQFIWTPHLELVAVFRR